MGRCRWGVRCAASLNRGASAGVTCAWSLVPGLGALLGTHLQGSPVPGDWGLDSWSCMVPAPAWRPSGYSQRGWELQWLPFRVSFPPPVRKGLVVPCNSWPGQTYTCEAARRERKINSPRIQGLGIAFAALVCFLGPLVGCFFAFYLLVCMGFLV